MTIPADKAVAIPPPEVRELQWVIDNIFTIARREHRRIEDGKMLRPEMWGHVLRLCEKVGAHTRTVGVLREGDGFTLSDLAIIGAALDNAVENGCAEELSRMSDEDIAYDLAQLDADCERLPMDVLRAGVRAWRNRDGGHNKP